MQDKTTSTATAASTTLDSDVASAPQALAATAAVAAGCQVYPPTSFQVCGAIRDKYNQMGGPTSFLLLPKSNELTNPGNTGKRSEFIGGNIYWSSATGAHPVAHEFLFKWGDHGYETGFLKYPKTDEIVLTVDGISRRQEFQGGHIYWSPATGAHSIQGLIYDKWKAFGAETGVLKFPTSDEIVAPDGKGRFTNFQGGAIYWHPSTGAHPVVGAMREIWGVFGYEAGQYGYPVEDAVTDANGTHQKFQRGTLRLYGGGFIEGVRVPVAGDEEIYGFETEIRPGYPAVDLSEYRTQRDTTGDLIPANQLGASTIAAYFEAQGYSVSGDLFSWYYGNTGADHRLSTSTVDQWMLDNSKGASSPIQILAENRDQTVALAINRADATKEVAKIGLSTPWKIAHGSEDLHYAMGDFSLSCTTVVVAYPGTAGNHRVRLLQQAHVVDVYDFRQIVRGDEASSGVYPDTANNIAYRGMTLGIAKPFLDYGSGSKVAWEGLR
ncbi:hypothetical protein QSJ19_26195 [Gordonia sp. ABSL11-1]|uniref:LGFP repeat-containing protein n=1 Tax=Gordonia sp. ABSL11-1 TaxID=3053924 RepID=UPI0025739682|nr:hypothetical protein [Gordonia sp. ABSL11-1]MDL9949005.1 hypothetical protein [Gordonia sp. ABSL11-1]